MSKDVTRIHCNHCNKITTVNYLLCITCGNLPKKTDFIKELTFGRAQLHAEMYKFNEKIEILNKIPNDDNPWAEFRNGFLSISYSALINLEVMIKEPHVYNNALKQFGRFTNSEKPDSFLPTQDLYNKDSFLTLFLFTIENFFDNLIRNSTKPKKYTTLYDKTKYLFEILNLGNEQSELFYQVLFPLELRNLLHANGIYNNSKPFDVTIKKINFKFIPNNIPEYASWIHICFCFTILMEVINIIFDHPHFSRFLPKRDN